MRLPKEPHPRRPLGGPAGGGRCRGGDEAEQRECRQEDNCPHRITSLTLLEERYPEIVGALFMFCQIKP